MRVATRLIARLASASARPGLCAAQLSWGQSPALSRARFSTESHSIPNESSAVPSEDTAVSSEGTSTSSASIAAVKDHALKNPIAEKTSSTSDGSVQTLHVAGVDTGIKLRLRPEMSRPIMRTNLSGVWLRDNCRCPICVNQDTKQRNFKTSDIPLDIKPESVTETENHVLVTWPDGHKSRYDWEMISFYTHASARPKRSPNYRYHDPRNQTFDRVSTTYQNVMKDDDRGVGMLTYMIKTWGFAIVEETPYDDPIHTKKLLERIGPIRETHYGGFYDFTPDLSKADTAYTNLALAPHTDTTYFTDPAGLQAFHLLSHTPAPGSEDTEVTGGKSLLVDGFRAAQILRDEMPSWYYDELQYTAVPWHASGNKGVTISPRQPYPVFERARDQTKTLQRIRWNNDDRGVLPLYDNPDRWYEAAGAWQRILDDPKHQIWIQLKPGMTLIFDNWRMLHGRSAFNGVRRICGGYVNRDDFISKFRNTNMRQAEVYRQVIGW